MGHADRLVAHKRADLALSLVRERFSNKNSRNSWQLCDWLKRFYQVRKNWGALLDLCQEEFRRNPSLEGYQEVRKHARKLKTWDSLRPDVMASVPGDSTVLIRIHLDEGEVAQAIERLESRPKKRGFISGWDRVDLDVAKAAEASHPETAAGIYRAEAEALIAARGRENYQAACKSLEKVRQLLTKVGRSREWEDYCLNLRMEHRALRALQEELTKGGI